jgi:CRP-like cAMP-binding protein
VPFQLTHEEIAANLGCDRVMVSRIISELTKGDYLSIEKKIITINIKLPKSR